MNAITFKAFVKEAIDIQAGSDAPSDYLPTRAAALALFPKLANPYAELAGLGTLMAPSIQEMRNKPMSEKHKAQAEVGGLGILAAPYAHDIAKTRSPAYGRVAGRVGQALRRVK